MLAKKIDSPTPQEIRDMLTLRITNRSFLQPAVSGVGWYHRRHSSAAITCPAPSNFHSTQVRQTVPRKGRNEEGHAHDTARQIGRLAAARPDYSRLESILRLAPRFFALCGCFNGGDSVPVPLFTVHPMVRSQNGTGTETSPSIPLPIETCSESVPFSYGAGGSGHLYRGRFKSFSRPK